MIGVNFLTREHVSCVDQRTCSDHQETCVDQATCADRRTFVDQRNCVDRGQKSIGGLIIEIDRQSDGHKKQTKNGAIILIEASGCHG